MEAVVFGRLVESSFCLIKQLLVSGSRELADSERKLMGQG